MTVPALPGLVTEGKDLDHARTMAKDAVRCYIESQSKVKEPIPVDRDPAQVNISIAARGRSEASLSPREDVAPVVLESAAQHRGGQS